MTRLVVIGLDGAGLQLLQPWLDEGELPTLASLIEGGRAGPLRSVYPPVTCPSWRCYSTGVNPGKHGVFWWEQIDREEQSFRIPTSKDFAAPDVWDLLGETGHQSAVINMPTTFPPEELDGWMISGGGGVSGNDYTHPPALQEEIEARFDYDVFISGSSGNIGEHPERVSEVLDLISTRFDVATYLRKEYDPAFISLVIFYTNVFHHFFWDDETTKRVWKHVDDQLASFLDPEDNVVLISDHGSNPIHFQFNINTWLERQGYLVTSDTVSDSLHRVGAHRDRLTNLVDRLGLKNTLKRLLPRELVTLFPRADGSVVGQGKADKIDWDRSTAFASGQGPIYLLTDDRAERERIGTKLRAELGSLTTPSGTPVARAIYAAEEIYDGPHAEDGPDIVVDQGDNVHIYGALGSEDIFEQPTDWQAENHRDGLIVANGPAVARGGGFETQPQIYDLAPTILHWFGCPVPEYLDGRVLTELFSEEAEPGRRTVEHTDKQLSVSSADGVDNQEQIRDRLQDLGYLSE